MQYLGTDSRMRTLARWLALCATGLAFATPVWAAAPAVRVVAPAFSIPELGAIPPQLAGDPDGLTYLRFQALDTACGELPLYTFLVNDVTVGQLPLDPGGSCRCEGTVNDYVVDDPAALAAVQLGDNRIGFSKQGGVGAFGWMRVFVGTTAGEQGPFCIFDARGEACGNEDLCHDNTFEDVAGEAVVPVAAGFSSVIAEFTDPDGGAHTARVEWGDGVSSAGQVVEADGAGTVNARHVYQDAGLYPGRVCVADEAGEEGCMPFTVTVTDLAPVVEVAGGLAAQPDEPVPPPQDGGPGLTHVRFQAFATTCTAPPRCSVTVDGATMADFALDPGASCSCEATLQEHVVDDPALLAALQPGNHLLGFAKTGGDGALAWLRFYLGTAAGEQGPYCLHDVRGEGCNSSDFCHGYAFEDLAGEASFDLLLDRAGTIATFTDPDGGTGHVAQVSWGDGSTSQAVVVEADGAGAVLASHRYAAAGAYAGEVCVSDAGGSTGCERFTVIVGGESLPPVAEAGPDQELECTGGGMALATLDGRGSSDPDGQVLRWEWEWAGGSASGETALAPFGLGSTTVALVVTDDVGLDSAPDTLAITVLDRTPPLLQCPADRTLAADDRCVALPDPGFTATAADACTAAGPVVDDRPASFPLGVTAVTFHTEDEAGNVASCQAAVEVVDLAPPLLPCPPPVVAECASPAGTEAMLPAPTPLDDCDPAPAAADTRRLLYPLGETPVIYTAEDAAGNRTACTALVTIVDTTPPELTCPAPVEVGCAGPGGARVALSAQANDSCDGAVPVRAERSDGAASLDEPFPAGTTEIVFTASDASGNSAACSTRVSVGQSPTSFALYSAGLTDDEITAGQRRGWLGWLLSRLAGRKGRLSIQHDARVEGSVFAAGDVKLGRDVTIQGTVYAGNDLFAQHGATIQDGASIGGRARCADGCASLGPPPGDLPALSLPDTAAFDGLLAQAAARPRRNMHVRELALAGQVVLVRGSFELAAHGVLTGPGTVVATDEIHIRDAARVGNGITLVTAQDLRLGKGVVVGEGCTLFSRRDLRVQAVARVAGSRLLALQELTVERRALVAGLLFGRKVKLKEETELTGAAIAQQSLQVGHDARVTYSCAATPALP